jgi:hypothetical protein
MCRGVLCKQGETITINTSSLPTALLEANCPGGQWAAGDDAAVGAKVLFLLDGSNPGGERSQFRTADGAWGALPQRPWRAHGALSFTVALILALINPLTVWEPRVRGARPPSRGACA